MRDYRKWKRSNPRVTSLLLDAANPRIPKGRGIHEQRELIAELVEHDSVYELAKDIVSDGYFPLEYLIAIEDDGKAIVVEGNRRLAALKLLVNPGLAPVGHERKFKTLSANVSLDLIDKVPTIYAPSRELAAPLIMQKHTRQQVARWSVLMQASFYKLLAESGVKLSELAEQYNRPPSEIAGFLRIDTMYAIACTLEYADDVAEIVRDPRSFPAAVLQRLLDVPKFREFLGIEFKDQVKLIGKVDSREFKKAFAKVITDIANEDVNTRSLNSVDDIAEYLIGLSKFKPKKDPKAHFSAETFDISVPELAKATASTSSVTKSTKRGRSPRMIPPGVRCELTNQRIVDIFNELRKLCPDQNPNACAVLLRILLELCVSEYLEATGKIRPLLESAKRKGRPSTWYPTLRQTLDAFLGDSDASGTIRTQARKRLVQMVASSRNSILSLDDIDGYVHSPYTHPTARDLFTLWDLLDGVFAVVLKVPEAGQKQPRK